MNSNNANTKTDPSKQDQATVQPIRDEHGQRASAPSKAQGDADTTKRDAAGKDGKPSSTSVGAK